MRKAVHAVMDVGATAFGTFAAPVLRYVGKRHASLPMFQRLQDRLGYQIRTSHYYEPTYRESDLPAMTTGERDLPGVDLNETGQLALLGEFRFASELQSFPIDKPSVREFGHDNPMYSYADAETLYSIVRAKKPSRFYEIGSGQSTLVVQAAIAANKADDPGYACEHVCVEPYEADWLEATGVRVIRDRVETLDIKLFDALGQNDVLFIDSSHVIRPWGDVLREYQQIIPRLANGVMIHVHDIFTPRDYPEAWLRKDRRLWNEQYLLESFLAFNSAFEIVCATNWLKHNHGELLGRVCPRAGQNPAHEPGSFWFRRR